MTCTSVTADTNPSSSKVSNALASIISLSFASCVTLVCFPQVPL
jgi:hypothetical protein